MRRLERVMGLQAWLTELRAQSPRPILGLVPTMGALHRGHAALIQRARQDCDAVIVTIFVNPLQFGPQEDFDRYPRTLELDQQLCTELGVDVVFAPSITEFYGTATVSVASQTTILPPPSLIAGLCGRSRPGHFQGVATIVTKLLGLIQPDRAYFGQKDAQQLALIRQLVKDLHLAVEVVAHPIVREADGLAYSSRNRYLTPAQRHQAPSIYRSLQKAQAAVQQGITTWQRLQEVVTTELATCPDLRLDYAELVNLDTMEPLGALEEVGLLAIAAYLGETRLIDNLVLRQRQPIVAIDGPAGAGKSTVARQVAHRLNLLYLDTGAMYRAVTWFVLDRQVAIDDRPRIAELLSECQIDLQPGLATPDSTQFAPTQVRVNGVDVTQAIRSAAVTAQVSAISAQPLVRQTLAQQQQAYGRQGGVVMEGRDIGTHIFPDAELKIFLTASVQERARRRQQDLQQQNQPLIALDVLEQMIDERDRKDRSRAIAPLRQAEDAIEVQTDHLTVEEVIQKIVTLYQQLVVTV